MQTKNEPYEMTENGWTVRVQPPRDSTNLRALLLLHGLMGDEKVMWIFTRNLPGNLWMFAPRAPLPAGNGYSWVEMRETWSTLADFETVAGQLLQAFDQWAATAGVPADTFDVMGFSQGAAMSFALAAIYPQRVNRIMALAGFAPAEKDMPGRYSQLRGKPVYIAHGSRDETVPVSMARDTVQMLKAVGAQVTYCESDVGHKLAADCLRGLDAFI